MPHGQQQAENSNVVTHWCGGLVFVDEAQKAICGRKRIYLQVATYMDLYLKENVSTTFLLRNKRPFVPSKEAESRCLKGLTHKKRRSPFDHHTAPIVPGVQILFAN